MPSIRLCILLYLSCSVFWAATPADNAWKFLKEGLQDKSAEKRTQAVAALGLIPGNSQALKIAEDALQDPNSAVRIAAVTALGEMNAKSALPKIKGLLQTSDASSIVAIASVLKKLNDPEGYEIYYEILTGTRKGGGGLLSGIKDRKSLEKMGIEEALGFIPFGGIGVGAYNYIKTNTSQSVNAAAATELALDPDPAAEKALVAATSNGKDVVQVAALRALAKRGDPSVVDDIEHQMYADKPLVVYTACAAVIHLSDVRPAHSRRPRSA